jgi:hypothetical protein
MTIPPFPQEMDELMNRMWTDLGTIVSAEQLATAKKLHFEKFFPHNGKKPVVVEIWQEENGEYHYIEATESANASNTAGAAGLLPPRYRGLLMRDNQKTNN